MPDAILCQMENRVFFYSDFIEVKIFDLGAGIRGRL